MANKELTKICSTCKTRKKLSEFYKDKSRSDGLNARCKKCISNYCKTEKVKRRTKQWQKDNAGRVNAIRRKYHRTEKGKLKSRRGNLKYNFGLTLAEYNLMLEKQNGLCAVCDKPEGVKNQYGIYPLGVDHNHKTGQIRGLLCNKCNIALGLLKVDELHIELLLNAISYIKNYDE